MAHRRFRIAWLCNLALLALGLAVVPLTGPRADSPAPGEAWKSSPFHGVENGATGQRIPCLCRFKGEDYRLGASVCMSTHLGTVVARCDLSLNNTTWVPTDQPCQISRVPGPVDVAFGTALSQRTSK